MSASCGTVTQATRTIRRDPVTIGPASSRTSLGCGLVRQPRDLVRCVASTVRHSRNRVQRVRSSVTSIVRYGAFANTVWCGVRRICCRRTAGMAISSPRLVPSIELPTVLFEKYDAAGAQPGLVD
jgi:hypothetical protein